MLSKDQIGTEKYSNQGHCCKQDIITWILVSWWVTWPAIHLKTPPRWPWKCIVPSPNMLSGLMWCCHVLVSWPWDEGHVRVIWAKPIETQRSWLRDRFPDHILDDSDVAGVTTWNSLAASLSLDLSNISCDVCNIYCCTPTFKRLWQSSELLFTGLKFLWLTLARIAQALVY